jgi:hypothetical protein
MRFVKLIFALSSFTLLPMAARAQDPPPRIGHFVIDARGSFPLFQKHQQLAESRGLTSVSELPGAGLGADAGAHLYLFTWKAVTVGIGGQLTFGRSHASPSPESALRPVTERFTALTPQLTLNFGNGNGWSYLSGGIGAATLSIVPDGRLPLPADETRLRTVNYGGGARWFIKPRLGFTLDVRFHQIDPGIAEFGRPGSPRITFVVMGAGASLKVW